MGRGRDPGTSWTLGPGPVVAQREPNPHPEPPALPSHLYVEPDNGSLLPGIHVHAASLLMSAVIKFFMRLTSRGDGFDGNAPPRQRYSLQAAPEDRTSTPVFLDGCLCEHVEDAANDNAFWMCIKDVPSDEYVCRRAEKAGKWVWYCSRVVP